MKILLKYIFNNIREHMLRTVVMLLSIVLSTTLLFAALSIGDSYASAQRKMAVGLSGKATLAVSARPGANGSEVWISEDEIPQLAYIQNKAGYLTATALFQRGQLYENFDLFAFEIDELNSINKPRLMDGTSLTNFTGNSIVLPEKFTSAYHVKPGDPITLNIGGTLIEFKVAAIAPTDTVFLRQTRGFNALVPKQTLSEILKASDGNSKILLAPAEGIGSDDLKARLESVLPQDRYLVTKTFDEASITSGAREKSLPFYLVSFFSLVMSVFIIFSSYRVITMERLPVIGTFRSIGATQKATTGILLMESLVYGLAGGLLGIAFGYGVLKMILTGLRESLSIGVEIPIVVAPLNLVAAGFVAIAVSMLSAYIPVRRASKLPVKDVVLGMVEEKTISNRVKLGFGVVLFILSIALPRLGVEKSSNLLMALGGLSLLGLIVAAVIIVPLLTDGLSIVLEWIYARIFGNEGKLAARNMRNNKNIQQNVTLLLISLSAVIVISVVITFAVTYVGDVFGGGLDGFAQGDMDSAFVDSVRHLPGVKNILAIHNLDGMVSADGLVFTRMEAVDDLSSLNAMLNLVYNDPETQKAMEDHFAAGRYVLLSEACMEKRKLLTGDTLHLSYQGQEYEYRIAGSFKSRADNSDAIIPASYAERDFGSLNYGMLAYQAADPNLVMAQIRNLFRNRYNWSRTVKEFKNDFLGVVDAFLAPMKKLTYFILALAAIGVINNLIINFIQKKHSIAMYKSVGLSNRQNIKMTIIEGLTSGLIGASVGLLVAYLEVDTIFIVAGPRISVQPQFDPTVFILSGLAGVIITLIGSVVPILKSSEMKLVEEIKFE